MLEISRAYPIMYHNAVYQGVLYLEKYPRLKTLVLGLSGGIDSAITALLARRVCDSVGRKVRLIGVSLPIATNKQDEIQRADMIGHSLCDDFIVENLTKSWENLTSVLENRRERKLEDRHDIKVRLGNSKARLRMMYLYDLAQYEKGMVLSTDNLTEYYLGFWTLHGDVGDFCFIQNLWKTEVYELATWVTLSFPTFNINGLKECIDAVPTDGLGVSESDLHQVIPGIMKYKSEELNENPFELNLKDLNYRDLYKIIDQCLIDILTNKRPSPNTYDAIRDVESRYEASQFKRENPFNVPREKLFAN